VSLPHARDIAAIYLHIVLAEAAAYHANTLERRPDDYTPNVRMRLEMGRYVLGEDYARAMRGREMTRQEVDAALQGTDALLLPSTPIAAPKIGAATVKIGGAEEPCAQRDASLHAGLQRLRPSSDLDTLRNDHGRSSCRGTTGRTGG
jgi:Asp-tRNA(Asn)/Glu-tRNA(Gln) amidotransferase A subunit family amidase